jgi:hypothetical protein
MFVKAFVRLFKLPPSCFMQDIILLDKSKGANKYFRCKTHDNFWCLMNLKILIVMWQGTHLLELTTKSNVSNPSHDIHKSNETIILMVSIKARRTWCSMVLLTILDITLLQSTYMFGNITLLHYWKINFLNQIFFMKFKCGILWWYININPPSISLHLNISIITILVCANYNRVDLLNIKHLSA